MLLLIRCVASFDHKGRPNHTLAVIHQAITKATLRRAMDRDVERIKADDIATDIQNLKEDAENEGKEYVPTKDDQTWESPGERWEMQVGKNELRELCYQLEGEPTSITYHILSTEEKVGQCT